MSQEETNNIYASLKEKFNPEGSDLRRYQLRLLTILIEFDKFCKEHNLSYSLAYGTLLGAVRHQGFIPWDDDVDVMMTREQYNALVKVIGTADVVALNNKLSIRRHLKPEICMKGVGICDLFIIDYIPNNRFKQWIKKTCIQLVQFMYRCRLSFAAWQNGRHPRWRPWKIFIPFSLCMSVKKWQSVWDKIILWYLPKIDKEKKLMGCYTANIRDISKIFPCDIFTDTVYLDFEGYLFPCIKGYDKFLSIRYGNYMKLPNSIHNHGRLK